MAKRRAPEELDAMEGVTSPAPKKQRNDGRDGLLNGQMAHGTGRGDAGTNAIEDVSREDGEEADDLEDDLEDETTTRTVRQAAPTAGYDDLYLDTIDRQVLDFDFEKLCSVSLSNINVYACLVCGRYYQGRGLKSHAYFHALDEDHHVFINMQTQRVYVLPEGYEVLSRSLDDIKFVADPRYTRSDIAQLDQRRTAASKVCYTLAGKPYAPGYVGMNNIKENDYLNVVVQALAHVPPLRNFLLLDEFKTKPSAPGSGKPDAKSLDNPNAELVKRFGLLVRKIWNPRAFKAHVSPHELLQEVALRSNKRFTLTAQADPVDFLTWFLNHLHLGLGGSRTRPGSSIVQRVFQGKVRVETEKLAAVGAAAAAAAAAATASEQGADKTADAADSMMIDTPLPVRPGGGMLPPPPPPPGMAQQHPLQHQPPPPGMGGAPGFSGFAQPPPPGVLSAPGMFSAPPPPPGPPGLSGMGASSLPPPPSSLPPPPSSSSSSAAAPPPEQQQQQQQQQEERLALSTSPPKPTVDVNRFLLLTLDLPPAPLFQDEQERNIIPQVPLTTLLSKYDGQSAHIAHVDHGDVRRRFQLQGPLPPYLVLHMKRFTVNKFITERNPTIVTFDPKGLDMRPYVEGVDAEGGQEDEYTYDLVANVVHEAERARGDDVAVDSAEERRTWKVQLRDRSGATATNGEQGALTGAGGAGEDKWVVAQDLFVEPVAGELLYLAESYIQIWERRRQPTSRPQQATNGSAKVQNKGKAAASTNGGR